MICHSKIFSGKNDVKCEEIEWFNQNIYLLNYKPTFQKYKNFVDIGLEKAHFKTLNLF